MLEQMHIKNQFEKHTKIFNTFIMLLFIETTDSEYFSFTFSNITGFSTDFGVDTYSPMSLSQVSSGNMMSSTIRLTIPEIKLDQTGHIFGF